MARARPRRPHAAVGRQASGPRGKQPSTSAPARPAAEPLARTSWIALGCIVLAAMIAFAPAIRAPFAFDDVGAIVDNPTIQRVFPLSSSLRPPPRLAVSGRPVVNFSLALDHAASAALGADDHASPDAGSSAVVYHLTNLAIHLLCGLLLFGVLRRTLALRRLGAWANENAQSVALVATAVWLVHPIQTEAVDYVIQRTELLVSLCGLATLYASIRAWDADAAWRRTAWLAAGVAACVAGMGSKEVMAGVPLLVVLYDRVFRESSWRALAADVPRRWFYAALAASWLLLAALIAAGGRADSVGFGLGLPWHRYLLSQGWSVAHYVQLLAWPADLRFDYGFRPVGVARGLLGGAVILIAAAAAVAAARRGKRWWIGFLAAWFVVLLAPSSSIVPIQTEIAAERRVYLASASVIVGVVIAAAYALRARRRVFLAGAVVVTAALVARSAQRSALYANPEGLWRDALAKVPDNPRAYDNLAAVVYRKDRGRVAEADSLWTRAIAVDSTYMPPWSNLAQIRVDEKRPAEARALLEHALRINPDYVDATRRLGGLLAIQGDPRSIGYLERMAGSPQATDETFVALAQAYVDANRPADAVAALRRALALNPRRADAAAFLGAMLAQSGQAEEATPYLEQAVANGDQRGMTLALLGFVYAQRGRTADALRLAQQASAQSAGDEQVLLTLGRAMLAIGRGAEAEAFLFRATQAAPRDPEALTRLGIVRAAKGDLAGGVALFRLALEIAPGYPPAVQALAKAGAR